MSDDITTKPGFIARSRKAIVAAVAAFATSAGPVVVLITGDGHVDFTGEVLPALIIATGLALGAGIGVWAVPNAQNSLKG